MLSFTNCFSPPRNAILNQKYPTIIDRNEAISTESFDVSCIALSSKANVETKMDIVNPIPAKILTPMNCSHPDELMVGNIRLFVNPNIAREIPSGFPTNRPRKIPRDRVEVKPANADVVIKILVLAKAKRGKITKLTGRCSFLS